MKQESSDLEACGMVAAREREPAPLAVSLAVAARLIGISRDSMYRIPAHRLPWTPKPPNGRGRLYLVSDLEQFLRDERVME